MARSRGNIKHQSIVLRQAHGRINCKVLNSWIPPPTQYDVKEVVDLGKHFLTHQLNRQKYLRFETEDTVLLVMLG
jgi:hypothetical protein